LEETGRRIAFIRTEYKDNWRQGRREDILVPLRSRVQVGSRGENWTYLGWSGVEIRIVGREEFRTYR
jgi:hypothetical protein